MPTSSPNSKKSLTTEELLEKVVRLQDLLTSAATGGGYDDKEYRSLREELLQVPRLRRRLPSFLTRSRSIAVFWAYIKPKFAHYQERRNYLADEFEPSLQLLEAEEKSPNEESVSETIARLDSHHIADAWRKATQRLTDDPEGAITAARTLVESVCKHILDESGVVYDEKDDLPRLYGLTAEQLSLSPGQQTEQIFKQILGGCKSVVEGLGALRNKLSDAHGKGQKSYKPSLRHAELAVNLAGSMATFIVSTWGARIASKLERK
jgi:hypothetical protein